MASVARPDGIVVVLDYDHVRTRWEPEPPASVRTFFDAFLRWRAQAGMDNEMARHLEGMFLKLGLREVRRTPQDEVVERGAADFEVRIGLWEQVIATRGHQLVADGALSESERARAGADFAAWARETAQRQTLVLAAVEGVVGP